jgi:Domain of unknown function (DUF2470)
MAAPTPKQRIISHMNAEHADSLEDYLKFYNSINAVPGSAKMVGLSLDAMKIEYRDEIGVDTFAIVKFLPPMSSLSESRARLVAMAEEATGNPFHQSPDFPSPVNVPAQRQPIRWTFPELPGLVSLLSISFGFWALSNDYPLSKGGPLEPYLLSAVITFARTFRPQLFAAMIAIHVIEAGVVAQTCWQNGVAWPHLLLWTVNGALEGGPAIVRINRLVEKHKNE